MTAGSDNLATELEELTELLYLIPTGIAQIDTAGSIAFINPLAVQLLMPAVGPGDNLSNLFDALAVYAPDLRQIVRDFAGSHGDILKDYRMVISAGSTVKSSPVVYALSLVKLDSERIMASLQDISESVRHERLIRRQEAWINAVLVGVNDYAITLLDPEGKVSQWNEGLQRVAGFNEPDILARSCSLLFAGDGMTEDRLKDRLNEASANGLSLDEGWMSRADGGRFWGHTVIMPAGGGTPPESYAIVIRNVTDYRHSTDALLRTANQDQLTGFANRRSFFDILELEVTRYRRSKSDLSLLIVDIDGFKQINEVHGHPAGEEVIADLARVLSGSVRDVDVVGRIGSDAFAVLLPSTPLDAAHVVAERILSRAARSGADNADVKIAYQVSIGIAAMDLELSGSPLLFEAADQALQGAKRAGRNRICMAQH